MNRSLDQLRELAARAVKITPADDAEAVVASTSSALTRFAGNRIHQNVAETDTELTIRAVLGTKTGVATTNRFDDEALGRCAVAAVEAARSAPEDPDFPGLPTAARIVQPPRIATLTLAYDAARRAAAARSIIEQSATRGLVAAGTVAMNDIGVAIANRHDVDAAQETAEIRATVLSTGSHGGSGWASFVGRDAAAFAPVALGDEAATMAERTADPTDLDPGTYTVVLAPDAVADIIDFLGFLGFGAKAFAEGGSFLASAVGTQVFDERISIIDDARIAETTGLLFDFEGQPKRHTPLVLDGVAGSPVTDSYYAAKLSMSNTGHALPAPNPYGPIPLNLAMRAGDATVDEMIASVERGVYVSRFHYVNVEDPMTMLLTGMTRDGTLLIENGRLTRPVRNLRFTQSVLEAFNNVDSIGRDRRLIGPAEGGAILAPAMLLEKWEFTGQTG